MSVLEILKIPNPLLKKKSEPIIDVNPSIRRILDDMADTMYSARGIGLAAPQIGVLKRLVVIDISRIEEDENGKLIGEKSTQYFINPEIIASSEECSSENEGCLSVPEEWEAITRPDEVTVKYLDRSGREQTLHCTGLLARCIQHEIDHLNGVVFIDRVSKIKKDIIIRRAKRRNLDKK